jgi:hypothetical protein
MLYDSRQALYKILPIVLEPPYRYVDTCVMNWLFRNRHKDHRVPRRLPSIRHCLWPVGYFTIKLADQECHFKSNGENLGRLWCPDRQIICVKDNTQAHLCEELDPSRNPVVWCDFRL